MFIELVNNSACDLDAPSNSYATAGEEPAITADYGQTTEVSQMIFVEDNEQASPEASDHNLSVVNDDQLMNEEDQINLVDQSPLLQLCAVDSNESSSTLQCTMDSQIKFLKNTRKEARKLVSRSSAKALTSTTDEETE